MLSLVGELSFEASFEDFSPFIHSFVWTTCEKLAVDSSFIRDNVTELRL